MRIFKRRNVFAPPMVRTDQPTSGVGRVTLFSPFKGIDHTTPVGFVDNEHAVECTNFNASFGLLETRYCFTTIGTPDSTVMQAFKFVISTGVGFLLRFKPAGVDVWTGSAWSSILSGATGTATDYWCWTAFNNTLIMSNGVDGMWEYDPSIGITTLISGAPSAKYLTTFNNRVIASCVSDPIYRPERIRWSVSRNSRNWTGIGSGYEDMLSTSAGSIDPQRGVWPISDYEALVVRGNSTWQMTVTGNPDAPFRFNRVHADLGTSTPMSIAAIPGGIMGLFDDDVYFVSTDRVERLGTTIVDTLKTRAASYPVAGTFYADDRIYVITAGSYAYVYSFISQAWTNWTFYGVTLRSVTSNASALAGRTVDELTGTIDALTGTIDSLVGTSTDYSGVMVVTSYGDVGRQNTSATYDTLGSVVYTTPLAVVDSGVVRAEDPLSYQRVIDVQIQCIAKYTTNVYVAYSYNGGQSWTAYSAQTLSGSTAAQTIRFRKVVTHQNTQFRLSVSNGRRGFKLMSFNVFLVQARMVNY